MKILLIGGSGLISAAVARRLAEESDVQLFVLTRGKRKLQLPAHVHCLQGDIGDEAAVSELLSGMHFDCVADFIAYTPAAIERDIRLFSGICAQYIFISTCATYEKPARMFWVDEATPQRNPFWGYAQEKIACEQRLMQEFRKTGFPATILRPCNIYGNASVPVPLHGQGYWCALSRMLRGKPMIVPGDGNSVWAILHCQDFAEAFLGIAGNHRAIGQAVHFTPWEVQTWDQILDEIGLALGKPVKKVHIPTDLLVRLDASLSGHLWGDKASPCIYSHQKLQELTPWFAPKMHASKGIRQAVAYNLAHKEVQKEDALWDAWCDNVIAKYQALENQMVAALGQKGPKA